MSGNPRWLYAGDGQSHYGGWSVGKCTALLAECRKAAAAQQGREQAQAIGLSSRSAKRGGSARGAGAAVRVPDEALVRLQERFRH